MPATLRISVVTCSYNQGQFIGETIESVRAQEYPDLEHIVVDGMSTDATPDVLSRYPHLKVIREPDRGQADAINKGFRAATGDVLCFLNSDDRLAPGALHRVAREIDPAGGRHVVMGRCRFIDEKGAFTGIEHPSFFHGHRGVLAIWKGHGIPQPAVFWTREVWERAGPLKEAEHLLLDYDLFCRMSRQYRFHHIDQVLAEYRLHSESKTTSVTDAQRLAEAVKVSRRYWGTGPERLYLEWSYALYRLDRNRRARQLLMRGRDAWRDRRPFQAIPALLAGGLMGPDVLLDVLVMPVLKPSLWRLVEGPGALARWLKPSAMSPQTEAWRDFTALHADGWAGPRVTLPLQVEPGHNRVHLMGIPAMGRAMENLAFTAFLDGVSVKAHRTGDDKVFTLSLVLDGVKPGPHELRIESSAYAVPHDLLGNGDHRPLSFRLDQVLLSGDDPSAAPTRA